MRIVGGKPWLGERVRRGVGVRVPPELGAVCCRDPSANGLGDGEEFILEGDEYETAFWDRGPKFFHYHPDDLIITSLEYDHADIYPDFETYELAFRRLVNLVPRRGRALAVAGIVRGNHPVPIRQERDQVDRR